VNLEAQLATKQVALEAHKRKAMEGVQLVTELKEKVNKLNARQTEVHQMLKEKTAALENEIHQNKRLQVKFIFLFSFFFFITFVFSQFLLYFFFSLGFALTMNNCFIPTFIFDYRRISEF